MQTCFSFSTLERIHFQGSCSQSRVCELNRGSSAESSERLSAHFKVHVSPMDYTHLGDDPSSFQT